MAEKCSYCGEEGHSIQQCPKWKRREPTTSGPPVKVEEMRRALIGMINQLSLSFEHKQFIEPLFDSVVYAAKTTMKAASERRVFIQDFAAALNRRAWLHNDLVETFCKYGYIYMEAQ